jgi:hypothetical protein
MCTVTLELAFLHVIGGLAIITAVFLGGGNLTLALLVRTFVPTFHIRDVIHTPPRSF